MNNKTILVVVTTISLLWTQGVGAVVYKVSEPQNKHNLSSGATHGGPQALLPASGGTDEICIFCHTPHGAEAQSTLWNRKNITAVETFPIYNSANLQIKNIAEAQYNSTTTNYPNGASRMCLSCHDGSVAAGYGIGDLLNGPNVLDGAPIAMTVSYLDPVSYNSAIDLTETHPVSFFYTQNVANFITANRVNNPQYDLPLASSPAQLDAQGRMQCTTCHDPHLDTRSEAHGLPFWVTGGPTAYDDVCVVCHAEYGWGTDVDTLPLDHHDPTFN